MIHRNAQSILEEEEVEMLFLIPLAPVNHPAGFMMTT
jgi:hypothetical protein